MSPSLLNYSPAYIAINETLFLLCVSQMEILKNKVCFL
ncbi:hypothetical protein Q7O_002368 [Pectobacterium carotovorum subsp. carotovorum PCCS1]|nr:hypothetical protein [Pectobacterium carotovorum subsp. carotovorum PCCS1]